MSHQIKGLAALMVCAGLIWGAWGATSAAPAILATPVRGGAAGNAGDANAATYCFAADSSARQLTRLNDVVIARAEAPALYGQADGMTIYAAGVDVASTAYQGYAGRKTPVGMDLSNAAGWPNIAVPSGRVAIDPVTGRFRFHTGGAVQRLGVWEPATSNAHDGVYVQGNYAYVTDWIRGLDIVDISDPAAPTFVANIYDTAADDAGMDVVVDGAYAYVLLKAKGLHIVNISNPASPQHISSIKASATENDVALHLFKAGNLVYVADEKFGVVIYNVSNPASPTKVGVCGIGFAESVWVEGRYAYITGGNNGFQIWDVLNPAAPVKRGELATIGYSRDVQVVGQYAYVTEGQSGLRVVNISNPASPTHVTTVATGSNAEAYDIRIANGCAYIAGNTIGPDSNGPGYLEVFGLANPAAPTLLRQYSFATDGFCGLYPVGPLVYVAAHRYGLWVINPNLDEAPSGAVTVDYNWSDTSVTPTPTLTPTITPTPDPASTMTLEIQAARQGRGEPPSARWAAPLQVQLAAPGGAVQHTYDVTANTSGLATVAGAPQGSYDVFVRSAASLQNVVRNRTLTAGTLRLDVGMLIEGDANLDNRINILDFSILASAYGTSQGQPGYDARGDANGDGVVNILDFSLLASNYGLAGPREVSGD